MRPSAVVLSGAKPVRVLTVQPGRLLDRDPGVVLVLCSGSTRVSTLSAFPVRRRSIM
jgi:hypothetical protein